MEFASNLESKKVFEFFMELTKIPRGTGNEKGVSDFLVKFAKDRNLDVWQDEALNVIIHKPGTKGYEDISPVIIQGHMDIVCEKDPDLEFDFMKDTIKTIVEDGYLKAVGTTLGADNGIAVAYGMALLDSTDIPHPPLEILLTTGEEVTMNGAAAVTNEHLDGKTLLNIDAEEEGVFFVSCAGGSILHSTLEMPAESCNLEGIEINVGGLKGGHSGMNIIDQRANSIKVIGRLLNVARLSGEARISEFEAGAKHNAIPRAAKAIVCVKDGSIDKLIEEIQKRAEQIKREFAVEDPDMTIEVKRVGKIEKAASKEQSHKLIEYMVMMPNGVFTMSKDIPGLVQTSSNLGVMVVKDGAMDMMGLARSSSKSEIVDVEEVFTLVAEKTGVNFEVVDRLVQWEYEQDSPVRDLAAKVYKDVSGHEAKFDAIHAGLECGLLKGALPDADMISFGPNLIGVHAPGEKVEIQSVENIWKFLKELLKEMK